jgi:hypothetical protein
LWIDWKSDSADPCPVCEGQRRCWADDKQHPVFLPHSGVLLLHGGQRTRDIKTYWIVFFDRDSAVIPVPPVGDNIREVALIALRGSLRLRGSAIPTPRVYNQRLSERRACAEAEAEALVRFGIPEHGLEVSANGKDEQRLPTDDGVAEPQNRRVEISLPINDYPGFQRGVTRVRDRSDSTFT